MSDIALLRTILPSGVSHSGIDRKNAIVRGVIVAEEGIFKDRRGQFSRSGLDKIVEIGNAKGQGLKTRWTHPTASHDGLGTFLGRTKNLRVDEVMRQIDGKDQVVGAIRGDLHLSTTSFATPKGNLGDYVMRLTDEDPDAINMSLVLRPKQEYAIESDGRRKKDSKGMDMPPYWLAEDVHAVDVVDVGAATNSMLSSGFEGLPERLSDDVLMQASHLLLEQFGDKPREFVAERLRAWCERALDLHWPVREIPRDRKRIAKALSHLTST